MIGRGRAVSVIGVERPLRAPVDGRLRRRIEAALRAGNRSVVLDLAGVSEIDAAGVGELVHAYNAISARHGVLRVAGTRPRVRALLERARLARFLSAPGLDAATEQCA